jgi:isoquinoline 1-oxidoreductase subunit beta
MSRTRTIVRRSFLIGSAAILGGVAFGTYLVKRAIPNPLLADLLPGSATFNPWVMVSSDGITLVTPHTDLGQGAASLQAALIAEEMDLAWNSFATIPGPPAAAYYNTALAGEAVPFLPSDHSLLADTARNAMGAVVRVMGIQITGGSSTTPDSFDKLRQAGAMARETLKAAAAQQTGHAVADLTTANSAVVLPDGTTIPYTALATLAATIDPVTDVPLRDPSMWRILGKPMQRLDMLAKSMGTQSYGIDISLDGMLHATVKLSPRRSALTNLDATVAKAMPGIKSIFPIQNGVAVVADNTWRAFQAANALICTWADAAYPAQQDDHWAAVAAAFTPDALDKVWRDDGDVAATLAAATPITAEYRVPYAAHQPLEPLSATIHVTDTGVDLWVATQVPRFAVDRVAAITGVDAAQVRLHNQYAGGSFGHRLEFEHIDRAAEIGKQMTGTPVKLTFSREEVFAQDYPRQIGIGRMSGVVQDGRVHALDLQIATTSAARSQAGRLQQPLPGPDMQIVSGAWNQPFAIPHFRVTGYAVPELAPVSSWRSVGAVTAGFIADCALDELIHAAGADPMAERLRLASDDQARAVLQAVATMSNWGSALAPGQGRGVAFVSSFGVPVAEVVEITVTDAGIKIDKVFVAAAVGRVLDPVNFDNNVKGAVIWGLGHAMNCEITYADGMVEQQNFYDHEGMRLHQCPEITVQGLEIGDRVRGIGEPPVPPAAPALANAIFAATGQRLREMPFNKFVDFV